MSADRFFELLPGVVRAPGSEVALALRDLLRVLGEEADLVEEDIRRVYADLFIETCEPWVIPYIGDLVGYRWLPVPEGRRDCGEARPVPGVVPRRAVADTIRHRRRKGTRSVLEDLVPAVSGWPAVVCDGEGEGDCAGAPPGRVTVRAWRLPSWPLTAVRPFRVRRRVNSFELSVLGNDAPLFTCAHPSAEQDTSGRPPIVRRLTTEALGADLPRHYGQGRDLLLYEDGAPIALERITVRSLATWTPEVFGDRIAVDPERGRVMFPERYELGELTASYCHGFPMAIGGGEYRRQPPGVPVLAAFLRADDLRGGFPTRLLQAQDPLSRLLRSLMDPAVVAGLAGEPVAARAHLAAELNRIIQAHDLVGVVDEQQLDDEAVALRDGAAAGPGRMRLNRLVLEARYAEDIPRSYALTRVRSGAGPSIADAVRALQRSARPPVHLVVELVDSGLYVQPVKLEVAEGHTLELRAAEGCRPTVLLPELREDIDDMTISCGRGSRILLDGLVVAAHPVRFSGDPAEVVVRHCTLVPGWELNTRCEPRHGTEPSLIITDLPRRRRDPEGPPADRPPEALRPPCVEVDRSIVGSIVVQRDEVGAEPIRLHVRTSVVDATTTGRDAVAAPNGRRAHAVATVVDSTVIGRTHLHAVELGENSIFTSRMDVARRQIGCLRYCYVTSTSRTPRRYACQPDLVVLAAKEEERVAEAARVEPRFTTLRYGRPDYCRLADDGPPEIRTGADDDSEMGVYHDLFEARRTANLRAALEEHLPLGWQLDIRFQS
ncbi:hypothetical protein [Geodermatophilus sp. SYSU D01105]